MSPGILVDTNVLVDMLTDDEAWAKWSGDACCRCADYATLVIDTTVYSKLAVRYDSVEALDDMIDAGVLMREHTPWAAAFVAGKAFTEYGRRGGTKRSPLPDFYIGAHAAVTGMGLLTRDPRRYRECFPTVEPIAPDD